MRKIAFFGGSFDPIHYGHIHLAIQMKELFALDEVIFCPAYISPHKTHTPPSISAFDRMKMVTLAIEGIKGFSVTDLEITREGVSFTVDTLRLVKNLYPHDDLYFLVSNDAFAKFPFWKDPEKILKMATPLVSRRSALSPGAILKKFPESLKILIDKKVSFAHTPIIQISATDIRERLKRKAYCKHLVPQKVLDYIHKNNLYSYAKIR